MQLRLALRRITFGSTSDKEKRAFIAWSLSPRSGVKAQKVDPHLELSKCEPTDYFGSKPGIAGKYLSTSGILCRDYSSTWIAI